MEDEKKEPMCSSAADMPPVSSMSSPPEHTVSVRRKPWTEALRPFSTTVEEAPLLIQLWQRFCPFIPCLLLLLWICALAGCLYWQPVWAVDLGNALVCWAIFEHVRVLIFGSYSLNKVLSTDAQKGPYFATEACEDARGAEHHHAVFICAYKEKIEVIRQTLNSIATQHGQTEGQLYAKSRIGVCLCMEAREEEVGRRMADELLDEFRGDFEWIEATYHPDKIEGEIQGKCSNLQWAITAMDKHIGDNCLVTCGDADSMFDQRYFAAVSSKCEELGPAGSSSIFQPTIMHMLNIFEQRNVVRASSIFITVMALGMVEDTFALSLPYSTFTVTADSMRRFNGWDSDYLNDDWHTGTKAFIADPINYQLVHIPYPVVNYAVDAETWLGAALARWRQASRHALGVEELVYLLQMLPVCHHRFLRDETDNHVQQVSWWTNSRIGRVLAMHIQFWRILYFVVSVHVRFAFVIPLNIALAVILAGVWMGNHSTKFPFYGQASDGFLYQAAFRWNLYLQVVLVIIVLGSSFIAVRMVQHLIAVGRIPGKSLWWAQSAIVQWIHNTCELALTMPFVCIVGSTAEVFALFQVAVWNKQSFEFYVAPKTTSSGCCKRRNGSGTMVDSEQKESTALLQNSPRQSAQAGIGGA